MKRFWLLAATVFPSLAMGATVILPAPRPSLPYLAYATVFTNGAYLSHTGDLTGIANSKTMTCGFWIKLSKASENSSQRDIFKFAIAGRGVIFNFGASQLGTIAGRNAAFSTIVSGSSASTFVASTTWHEFLFAFDLSDSAKRFMYIDGVAESVTWSTYTNDSMDFDSGANQGIMADSVGGTICTASLAEFVLSTVYLDISSSAVRARFRNPYGRPENLGADGSVPFAGVKPVIYLSNPSATFGNNNGGGGNFTVNGSLSNDPIPP